MWTIGREREKAHAAKFVKNADQKALLFPVIDAVHDFKDDASTISIFINASQRAMIAGGSGVWQNTANWIRKVGHSAPEANVLWDALAKHEHWQIRLRVAYCLYINISKCKSDELFEILRNDRSKKVREIAMARLHGESYTAAVT